MLEPKEVLLIGIASKISKGTVAGLSTNEHCIINEFVVEPTGVRADKIDCCVVVCFIPVFKDVAHLKRFISISRASFTQKGIYKFSLMPLTLVNGLI